MSHLEKNGAAPGESFGDVLVTYLKALLSRMNPETDAAYVAMPAFIGLISLVDFPEMEDKELEEAVQFEAKRFIPASLDDIALSWDVIRNTAKPDGTGMRQEVLVVAALKNEVERYRDYVEKSWIEDGLFGARDFSFGTSGSGYTKKTLCFLLI